MVSHDSSWGLIVLQIVWGCGSSVEAQLPDLLLQRRVHCIRTAAETLLRRQRDQQIELFAFGEGKHVRSAAASAADTSCSVADQSSTFRPPSNPHHEAVVHCWASSNACTLNQSHQCLANNTGLVPTNSFPITFCSHNPLHLSQCNPKASVSNLWCSAIPTTQAEWELNILTKKMQKSPRQFNLRNRFFFRGQLKRAKFYVLQFFQAACHKDPVISKMAVTCIHDIMTTLLNENSELEHFHFNEALFKPFENLLCLELCETDVQDQVNSFSKVRNFVTTVEGGTVWTTYFAINFLLNLSHL